MTSVKSLYQSMPLNVLMSRSLNPFMAAAVAM